MRDLCPLRAAPFSRALLEAFVSGQRPSGPRVYERTSIDSRDIMGTAVVAPIGLSSVSTLSDDTKSVTISCIFENHVSNGRQRAVGALYIGRRVLFIPFPVRRSRLSSPRI